MHIYIVGTDGIALCRKPRAVVTEGEIVGASNDELHAAALTGKRLLTLWNTLSSVENRRKVGDRDALINELWSAIEMLPDAEPIHLRPRVEAGRSHCDAASTRRCSDRRGGKH